MRIIALPVQTRPDEISVRSVPDVGLGLTALPAFLKFPLNSSPTFSWAYTKIRRPGRKIQVFQVALLLSLSYYSCV